MLSDKSASKCDNHNISYHGTSRNMNALRAELSLAFPGTNFRIDVNIGPNDVYSGVPSTNLGNGVASCRHGNNGIGGRGLDDDGGGGEFSSLLSSTEMLGSLEFDDEDVEEKAND
mmetsp:Transcript_51362/g.123981  ORF Transcript_51362/g.123981 Transcript_51362/m.123981 type:complete len:115 (+) Transcript_51362:1059-1403(+)